MNYFNELLLVISTFVLLLLSSCDNNYLDQKYEGYFYETKWIHRFNADGSYESSSFGHLGVDGVFDRGKYSLINSAIQMYSDIDDAESRDYRKFFILNGSEIIDLNGNKFYDKIPHYEDFDFELEDCLQKNIKGVIDSSNGYSSLIS